MSNITGKTKVCGIIGDPVAHSMSPIMHNAAFRELGLDFIYVAFQVSQNDLKEAVSGIRSLNIKGINVTIPHKVTIMPYLDRFEPLAKEIGAVNTVVNEAGTLTGYNTDAPGFLQALDSNGVDPKGKRVIILGAGGAARAISFALAENGAHLIILNRTYDTADKLAHHLRQKYNNQIQALPLNKESLAQTIKGGYLLVNTTSVGMSPNTAGTPVETRLLTRELIICDIVYHPLETRLLKEAQRIGAKTISGLDMLVWQGVFAFEKWTGQRPPESIMKNEALSLLGRHEN